MSDQYIPADIIGVIMLCADVRTAVNLASTCHGITLPALSHWHTVVKDSEPDSCDDLISSRSMLRADPPIPHGETVVTYWGLPPTIIHYDRGTVTYAKTGYRTWLGSRYANTCGGKVVVSGMNGPCIIDCRDDSTTVRDSHGRAMTFPSRPADDSALEILRWYARVAPDTAPAITAADVFRSTLQPTPRWA